MFLALAALAAMQAPSPADLVLTDGRIYTVDASHSVASAVAVKGGKIVFVGATAAAKQWTGPQTRTESLGGRLVLPGLVDAHVHPLDIVDLDVCDLDSRPVTLAELTTLARHLIGVPAMNPACIARRKSRTNQSCAVFWLAELVNSSLVLRTGRHRSFRIRREITASSSPQPYQTVMPGEGPATTSLPRPAQQDVDAVPSPGMTRRGKCITPDDSVVSPRALTAPSGSNLFGTPQEIAVHRAPRTGAQALVRE